MGCISPIHSGSWVPMLQSFLAFLWSNSTFISTWTCEKALLLNSLSHSVLRNPILYGYFRHCGVLSKRRLGLECLSWLCKSTMFAVNCLTFLLHPNDAFVVCCSVLVFRSITWNTILSAQSYNLGYLTGCLAIRQMHKCVKTAYRMWEWWFNLKWVNPLLYQLFQSIEHFSIAPMLDWTDFIVFSGL